jgi:hypothetical protein
MISMPRSSLLRSSACIALTVRNAPEANKLYLEIVSERALSKKV